MSRTEADTLTTDGSGEWRRIPPSEERDPAKVEHALRERIKELNCLYAITQLAERHPDSLKALLAGVVGILPPSWQYPESTCACIVFQGKAYRSPGFRATRWKQEAGVRIHGETVGRVTVCYRTAKPPADEGPFLAEERALIDTVAERIGSIAARALAEHDLQESNRQLRVEREALHETNMALRTVLARIEQEKKEMCEDIKANVERVLMPILQALGIAVPRAQRKYVELLGDSLADITSPFIKQVSRAHDSLTPTEIRVCGMVRNGLRSKEIAELCGVSPATVSRHREHIRRKLGLNRRAVNLTTHLQSVM